MMEIQLFNYKVVYKENFYKVLSLRPHFCNLKLEKLSADDRILVPKNCVNKASWLEVVALNFDNEVLLLSNEPNMFTFIKDKEI